MPGCPAGAAALIPEDAGESHGRRPEALPLILECFKQKGLRAVSVSELLPEGDTFVDSNGVQHCK